MGQERTQGTGLGLKKSVWSAVDNHMAPMLLWGRRGDHRWQVVSLGAFSLGSGLSPMETLHLYLWWTVGTDLLALVGGGAVEGRG